MVLVFCLEFFVWDRILARLVCNTVEVMFFGARLFCYLYVRMSGWKGNIYLPMPISKKNCGQSYLCIAPFGKYGPKRAQNDPKLENRTPRPAFELGLCNSQNILT